MNNNNKNKIKLKKQQLIPALIYLSVIEKNAQSENSDGTKNIK